MKVIATTNLLENFERMHRMKSSTRFQREKEAREAAIRNEPGKHTDANSKPTEFRLDADF